MESDRVVNASYSVDEQTEETAETETKPDDENKPEGNILRDEKSEDYTDKTDV